MQSPGNAIILSENKFPPTRSIRYYMKRLYLNENTCNSDCFIILLLCCRCTFLFAVAMRTMCSGSFQLSPLNLLFRFEVVNELRIVQPSAFQTWEACLTSSRLERLLSFSCSDVCSELTFLSFTLQRTVSTVCQNTHTHTQVLFLYFY